MRVAFFACLITIASACAQRVDLGAPMTATPVVSPSLPPTPAVPSATENIALPGPPEPSATPCVPPDTSMISPAPSGMYPGSSANVATPYYEGTIALKIAVCRRIDELMNRHGLAGPVSRSFQPPFDAIALATGLDRHFRVRVPVGDEAATVVRLARHPQDFDFVELLSAASVCLVTCPPGPEVLPATGARGTSFSLRFCCWASGATVEKIFTTPDGRVIRLSDAARSDGTVVAGWGSSAADVLGTYSVKVRGGGVAQVLSFRIE